MQNYTKIIALLFTLLSNSYAFTSRGPKVIETKEMSTQEDPALSLIRASELNAKVPTYVSLVGEEPLLNISSYWQNKVAVTEDTQKIVYSPYQLISEIEKKEALKTLFLQPGCYAQVTENQNFLIGPMKQSTNILVIRDKKSKKAVCIHKMLYFNGNKEIREILKKAFETSKKEDLELKMRAYRNKKEEKEGKIGDRVEFYTLFHSIFTLFELSKQQIDLKMSDYEEITQYNDKDFMNIKPLVFIKDGDFFSVIPTNLPFIRVMSHTKIIAATKRSTINNASHYAQPMPAKLVKVDASNFIGEDILPSTQELAGKMP